MNQIYLDIKGYAKSWFPDDPLDDLEGWEELWEYLDEVREAKIYKIIATHDPFGWYPKIYRLGFSGWELEGVGDYWSERDECLMSVNKKYCIYEYQD